MNRVKFSALLCAAVVAICAHANATAQAAAESQSIELGNVDEPEGTSEPMAPTAAAEPASNAAPSKAGTQSAETQAEKSTPSADSGVAESRNSSETPMEKYRDFKLQQAATPNGGNPATGRRYLKVDRATFMESSGIQ